ncbi:hypothetical protein COOONC_16336 [Cooperia oncophora]
MRFELLLLLTLLPLCVAADTCYYKGKTRSKYEKWIRKGDSLKEGGYTYRCKSDRHEKYTLEKISYL